MRRRDLLRGAGGGAFLAAATSYESVAGGLLMPTKDLIAQVPENIVTEFEGLPTSMQFSIDKGHFVTFDLSMEVSPDSVQHYLLIQDAFSSYRRLRIYVTQGGE